jgi:hypothetical protein
MKYPIKKDRNYTITKEWTGKDKPQYVIRFCNEWVDSKPTMSSATIRAIEVQFVNEWNSMIRSDEVQS